MMWKWKQKPSFKDSITTNFNDIINENLEKHSVYMSFSQYVNLVQKMIIWFLAQSKFRNQIGKPRIFTALCITPLQWFNFGIKLKKGKTINNITNLGEIDYLWTDEHWKNYHKFLIRRMCSNIVFNKNDVIKCNENKDVEQCTGGIIHKLFYKEVERRLCHDSVSFDETDFYRYIFTVNMKESEMLEYRNFPRSHNVETQLENYYIIVFEDQTNFMLDVQSGTIPNVLLNDLPYRIKGDKHAYLIVDTEFKEKHENNGNYRFIKLKKIFEGLFQSRVNSNYILSQEEYEIICNKDLPEDFIIFGTEEDWEFAIVSDVATEKQYVKVTFEYGNSKVFRHLKPFVDKIITNHENSSS